MAKTHKVVRKGDVAAVAALLNDGADVNAAERITHASPLHLAAGNSHLELIQVLIDRGGDLRAEASFGTPLHWANTPEAARVLLQNGVEIDVRSSSGRTPLHEAAYGPGKPVMVAFFLENGADPNALTHKDETPLDLTNGDEVRALLEPATGRKAWTPEGGELSAKLSEAALTGNVSQTRELLAMGAQDLDREALEWALAGGYGRGRPDSFGLAVWWAFSGRRMTPEYAEIASLIIDAKASDVSRRTKAGLTREGRSKRWDAFPPALAEWQSLGTLVGLATGYGKVIDNGETGLTPLELAVMSNGTEVMARLIDAGADVNEKGGSDETALHMAALYAAAEAAALLLDRGAEVNARTTGGESPLAWTSRWLEREKLGEEAVRRVTSTAAILREHGGAE